MEALDLLYADNLELDREISKRGLIEFMDLAWDLIEPSRPFVRSWHIGAVCEHLQATLTGEIRRLVISIPPGATKSMTTSVCFPAWAWAVRKAALKFVYGSNNESVVKRDSLRCLNLIQSDWYKNTFPSVKLNYRQEVSGSRYNNTAGGFRVAVTVGGAITGEHFDIQVADDPHKPYEVTGSAYIAKNALDKVALWWDDTMATRVVDHKTSVRIVMMQRLHEDDLAGRCVERDGYVYLCLPMEYEKNRKCITPIFQDPREEEGELLCAERFGKDEVEKLKKEMGPRAASAQLQMNPTPAEGGLFKKSCIRYYKDYPSNLMRIIQSWDCTFSEMGESWVDGLILGQVDLANYCVLDEYRGKWSITQTIVAIKDATKKWPTAIVKLIENKANGPAAINILSNPPKENKLDKIQGLIAINPKGSKEERAAAIEPLWTAGNIWLPEKAPWVSDFIFEVTGFPNTKNDDRVDALSQGINYMQDNRYMANLITAMKRIK